MPGYPDLPTRDSFGPTRESVRPVQNPERELGAAEMNLAFWQVAGAGRTLPQAVFIYDPNATPGNELSYQALAFDPKQLLPSINPTVNGTGDFTWTFDTTYLNEQGVARPFTPKAAMAMVQGGAAQVKAGVTLNGQTVQVETQDGASVAVDVAFILLVW